MTDLLREELHSLAETAGRLPSHSDISTLLREELLSLAQAAERLPNHPHISSVWRWCLRGIRGVRLKTILVGGRRYTTVAYLEEFVRHLTESHSPDPPPQSKLRSQQITHAAERAATTF
jgi:hypothetical protein